MYIYMCMQKFQMEINNKYISTEVLQNSFHPFPYNKIPINI